MPTRSWTIVSIFLACATATNLRAQPSALYAAPRIPWQSYYGGSGLDNAEAIVVIDTGDFVIAGSSRSTDGDAAGHHGDGAHSDCWVARISTHGATRWSRSLGGSSYDEAHAIARTIDGGIVVAGESRSTNGDVTAHHGDDDFSDAWVVKLDVDGALQWERSLGGSDVDIAYAVTATRDGGVAIAGASNSNDGDVRGHHGDAAYGDLWVARLNAAGVLLWQRSLGGTFTDEGRAIVQTHDGGFAVAGVAGSNDGDVPMNRGGDDLWIVKLDSAGTMLWSRTAGGSANDGASAIIEARDGRLLVAGYSFSSDGDVHAHNGTTDFSDAWLVTFSADGTMLAERSFGGARSDEARGIAAWNDGAVIAGWSESRDGDVTDHHGTIEPDAWIAGIDSGGMLRWARSVGTANGDRATAIAVVDSTRYVIAGTAFNAARAAENRVGMLDAWAFTLIAPLPLQLPATPAIIEGEAFPNPFSTSTTIRIPPEARCAQGSVLVVADVNGREVRRVGEIFADEIVLTRDNLREGTYIYRIFKDGAICCEGKLIVR